MRTVKKIVIEAANGKKYLVKDLMEDFHTSSGIIKAEDLTSSGRVTSSKGKAFFVLEPSFADLKSGFARGPQIIIEKDIGFILAKTGVNKDSVVVDAGGGSGSLCLSLANVCCEIIVYEKNPEHCSVIEKNRKMCGMENVTVKQKDVYEGIDESGVDLITLDLPEPWLALEHVCESLVMGGWLVVYLPNLTQVKEFVDKAKGGGVRVMETVELLERKWKVEERIMRPEFDMLGHTGFLIFARRF